jgi:site-specific recombinase XerD
MPTTIDATAREHVEAFIEELLRRWKPATAQNRYRALARFFAFCVEEGELRESPMRNMKPPKVPETPPEVLSEDAPPFEEETQEQKAAREQALAEAIRTTRPSWWGTSNPGTEEEAREARADAS